MSIFNFYKIYNSKKESLRLVNLLGHIVIIDKKYMINYVDNTWLNCFPASYVFHVVNFLRWLCLTKYIVNLP